MLTGLSNLQATISHIQNGLNNAEAGLNHLFQAYMKHSASVLAGGGADLEPLVLPPQLTANINAAGKATALVSHAVAAAAPVAAPEAGKKKRKREKKERDPNAPKRPLTAAFLFAQSARPIVKRDLEDALPPGEDLQPNAVNLEVTKRWNEMSEEDKDVSAYNANLPNLSFANLALQKWKASYRDSMEKYREDYKEYMASKGVDAPADLHDDGEVSDEAEAGALDSDVAESESEDDAVPIPLAKAPTPPAANTKTPRPNKRQKTAQTPQVNGSLAPVSIAPASAVSPVPLPASNKPSQTQVVPPGSSVETAKDKKDKKKKAAPQPIAPAPAGNKEPSPDDPKKKTKSGRSTRNAEPEPEVPAVEKEIKPTKKRDRSKRKSEGAAA